MQYRSARALPAIGLRTPHQWFVGSWGSPPTRTDENPGGFVPPGGPWWKSRLESPGKRRTWWFRRRSPSGGAFVRMGKRRERDWGDGPLIRSQRAQDCVERRAAGEWRQPKRGRPRGRSRACSPLAMGVSRSSAAMPVGFPLPVTRGGGWGLRRPPACGGLCRPEVGVPLPVTCEGVGGLRRPPACGGLCRPEAGVPLPVTREGVGGLRRPPACGGLCRPEVGVPLPVTREGVGGLRRPPACGGLCRPGVGVPLPVTRGGGWGLRRPPACGGLCRPEVGVPLPVSREGVGGLRRPPACGGLCRPEVGVPLRTAPSGPLSFRGTCIFTAIGFYVARPPAAGGAGPHRENWPEVSVSGLRVLHGGQQYAPRCAGRCPPEVGVFVPPRHAADRP